MLEIGECMKAFDRFLGFQWLIKQLKSACDRHSVTGQGEKSKMLTNVFPD